MTSRFFPLRLIAGACLLTLGACSVFDELPDWLGGPADQTILPGNRIAVLDETSRIAPNAEAASTGFTMPAEEKNVSWTQSGGSAQGLTGNLSLGGVAKEKTVRVGEGNGWEQALYPTPVIDGNTLFVMDAKGYISAHAADDISTVLWHSAAVVEEDEPDILGGGLAVDASVLYVTTGRGKVAALEATTGKTLWTQALNISLRAAPKVLNGRIFALSVDNQLFALNTTQGNTLWTHRGITETAGFIAAIAPAISTAITIVPHSSGEIHALDTISGQELWSDTLLLPKRGTATAGFSGIGGHPVIAGDTVYAAGSSGFTAALSLASGKRLWEQDISSLNAPWIAGDYVFLLSTDSRIICFMRDSGKVKWVQSIARYENEEKRKNPLVWRGPVMAAGTLWLLGTHGKLLQLAADTGAVVMESDVAEEAMDAPVIAGGRLYFITRDARMHVYY